MSGNAPRVSIVLPTHRRPGQLGECLAGLAQVDYPHERLEVVVVGDRGHAPLDRIVDDNRGSLDVRLVHQAPRGPAAARNEGVRAAGGELIAFVDDDCLPAPDWLGRLVRRWERDPSAAVGGHVVNALRDNLYARASQLIIDVAYRQNGEEPNAARFLCTNNLLLAREQFVELGGFDESFATAEDRDLADRWMKRGWPMRYVPDALVHHRRVMGLRGFVAQHFEYGRGAQRLLSRRAARGHAGPSIDLGFYLTVARVPLRAPAPRVELALVLLLWLAVSVAGFSYEAVSAPLGASRSPAAS